MDSKIPGIMVMIVLGLIVAALISGGGVNVLDTTSNETQGALNLSSNKSDYGSCVNNCRIKHPTDGAAYAQCKENRCS